MQQQVDHDDRRAGASWAECVAPAPDWLIAAVRAQRGGAARVRHVVRERLGLDLASYDPAWVAGILARRFRAVGLTEDRGALAAYRQYLEQDPGEIGQLQEALLFKLSRFFRWGECTRSDVWRQLCRVLLPALARRAGTRPLAIWSAGCAFGQEPYSLAILLAALGLPGDVWATDVSDADLAIARLGCYPASLVAEVPPALQSIGFGTLAADDPAALLTAACFGTDDLPYARVRDAIRARVHFERHDVTRATTPPGEPVFDLVLCRHVLFQFAPAARKRALALLVASLAPGGLLVLDGWRMDWTLLRTSQASGLEAISAEQSEGGIYRKVDTEHQLNDSAIDEVGAVSTTALWLPRDDAAVSASARSAR